MTSGTARDERNGGDGVVSITADAIARLVNGRLVGDPDAAVSTIAPLHRAGSGDLTFLASARYAALLEDSAAGVVLIAPDLADSPGTARARVIVAQPHDALLTLLPRFFRSPPRVTGIDASVRLGRGARLGRDVTLGPYAVIGAGATVGDRAWVDAHCDVGDGVEVGADTRLFPGVTLYPGTQLGERVIIHAGARIGSDGFGYVFRDGAHAKIPHIGRCIVADDVEIGANSTIDRGSIDDTVIGAGSKIDNLVHLGHNVRVGRLCLIMAQVGVSGSVRIEDGCIIAGQAGLGGHITIGAGARIAGQSGVFGDVPAGESWSGYPARPHKTSLRAQAALFRLPALLKRLERLLGASPDS